MAVRIQFRRGTASQWSGTNPILSEGEVGFETDTRKFKVGTGNKRWNDPDFPYYAVGTITAVVAGTGLTGGGTSGSVTLALSSTAITTDYVSAKGDLITATGDNSPTLLPVGVTDNDVLQVTSSAPTGLSYGKVQTSAIANNAVTESKILDTSISNTKIVDGAITAGKLATGSVTSTKIGTNAVTEEKIADGSVSTTKITTNAINTNQIVDLAVTGAKFADNSITSAKIANGTVVNEDINEFAGIGLGKLASGALPTTITVTTENYVSNSVNISKLSNTPGAEGVGVWQNWTPTVGGITGAQWAPVYCKYMKLNNLCTVQMIISFQSLSQSGGRTLTFSLPLTPVFAASLPTNAVVAMGSFIHWNQDTPGNSTVMTAVFQNDVIRHWTEEGAESINISESLDVVSFTTTYEVA
jgi:hypothetical protein